MWRINVSLSCIVSSFGAVQLVGLSVNRLNCTAGYRPTTLKPMIWWCYMDDIFAIWTHGETSLEHFIDDLNTAHPTIKFTAEWSHTRVSFLDTTVTLTNGILSTDLHTKSTDTHQYLHASSCHPQHCKAAIPYSQALRIKRICSSENDFKKHTDELQSFLINRGYNISFVRSQIRRASLIRRKDILFPSSDRKTSTRIPLVTTFHPNLPKLSSIINMHLPLLCASTQAFPERPFFAYRRPKNLRDLLVHANLKPSHLEPARGSSPCESKRCLTCQHIRSGTSVQSTVSGRTFRVHATANCKTSNVVYLIECSLCHVQYVGETRNALHIRMNRHRGDIYHRHLDKPVSAHFNSSDHNLQHLSIMVLEVMRSQNEDIRKMRENFWIFHLQSLHPGGLNLDP